MTAEELNKYLIDINQKIINLYYRKDENGKIMLDDQGNPINDYYQATTDFMDIGKGWYQLIHDLFEELIKTNWDRDVHQIKKKFGGLRFYIGNANQEVFDIISKYEELSYHICEVCGETGELKNDCGYNGRNWYKTLCNKHYLELKEQRKAKD